MNTASALRASRGEDRPVRRRAALPALLAVAAACLLWSGHGARGPGRPLVRGTLALADACRAAGVPHPPPAPRVVIRKAERKLGLYAGKALVKEYQVALGGSAVADKERQGDSRTPLGEFYVCTRLRQSRFHRFLGISYPAPEDAARGLKRRLITRGEYQAILRAHHTRRQPPWETRLGGAVGIHGGGSGADWTLGCIAVENSEVEELFAVLPLGTPVRILP